MHRILLSCLLFAAVIAAVPAASAAARLVLPQHKRGVTHVSPLAACTAGGPSGTLFADTAVEPELAVDPRHPKRMVGVWQQDRWSDGGAHGLVASASFDGGLTWKETVLPLSACATNDLTYSRASDPSVAIGPDGTVYVVGLSFDLGTGDQASSAVTATVSHDGGRTWSAPAVIKADDHTSVVLDDKEWVTADPVRAGTAYAVWDRLDDNIAGGPTFFSRTTDGGKTWSAPHAIVEPSIHRQTIGNEIVVDRRTGRLYDVYEELPYDNQGNAAGFHLGIVSSTDGGQHWTKPRNVRTITSVGVRGPDSGQQVRAPGMPQAAIDPRNGTLYVVWQDGRFNGFHYDEVAMSRSINGGATWSKPMRVNAPAGTAAFTPMVAVDGAGDVCVLYYTQSGGSGALPAEAWLTVSLAGATGFGTPQRIASFDLSRAPRTDEGYFLGDYEGLVGLKNSFVPFFSAVGPAGRTNVYVLTVK